MMSFDSVSSGQFTDLEAVHFTPAMLLQIPLSHRPSAVAQLDVWSGRL